MYKVLLFKWCCKQMDMNPVSNYKIMGAKPLCLLYAFDKYFLFVKCLKTILTILQLWGSQ